MTLRLLLSVVIASLLITASAVTFADAPALPKLLSERQVLAAEGQSIDVYYYRFPLRFVTNPEQAVVVADGELAEHTCAPLVITALQDADLGTPRTQEGSERFDFSCELLFWGPRAQLDSLFETAKSESNSLQFFAALGKLADAAKLAGATYFAGKTGNVGGAGTIATANLGTAPPKSQYAVAYDKLAKTEIMIGANESGAVLRFCERSRFLCQFIQGVVHKPEIGPVDSDALRANLEKSIVLATNLQRGTLYGRPPATPAGTSSAAP